MLVLGDTLPVTIKTDAGAITKENDTYIIPTPLTALYISDTEKETPKVKIKKKKEEIKAETEHNKYIIPAIIVSGSIIAVYLLSRRAR